MIKMVMIDMDGTLLNSERTISKKTKNTLIAIQTQGVKVALASGRLSCMMIKEAEYLELDKYGGYIASVNGGQLINVATKEELYSNELSLEDVYRLDEIAEKYDLETTVFYIDRNVVKIKNEDATDIFTDLYSNLMNLYDFDIITSTSLLTDINKPPLKCGIYTNDSNKEELMLCVVNEINSKLPHLNVMTSDPLFIECNPPNVSKGISCKYIANKFDILEEEIMVIGDGNNDISMFKIAGTCVAMENGSSKLKNMADFITLSNDNDGVAYAIKKFILNDLN